VSFFFCFSEFVLVWGERKTNPENPDQPDSKLKAVKGQDLILAQQLQRSQENEQAASRAEGKVVMQDRKIQSLPAIDVRDRNAAERLLVYAVKALLFSRPHGIVALRASHSSVRIATASGHSFFFKLFCS